jgi:S-DNA-T family DNA segregation ATPase FtsK/SpoIIIE
VQQAFGYGALIVPLALGVLGVAILVQERFRDARLSGSNVFGTFLVLAALLALLEFRMGARPSAAEPVGAGGGLVGWAMVNLLSAAVGRPVALLVTIVAALFGTLLTFNITLRDLALALARAAATVWEVAWSGPRHPAPSPAIAAPRDGPEPMPFAAPPGADDDIVATPIAERITRASLFRRPEVAAKPQEKLAPTPAAPPVVAPTMPKPAPAAPAPRPAAAAPVETVQEALEGIGVPAVQRAWPLPSLDLLESHTPGSITDDERRLKARLIEETLANFKVEARVVGVNTGPAITQFELQPAVGVKISKITSLERDLSLALASSIRIEAPIPGKSAVGIETPNSAISVVSLRECVDSEEFEGSKGKLKYPLGKDVSGLPVIADLTRMPHLLMAGATGSGKSGAINALLCGLLLKHTPDELKLIMVDPKMVELIVYNHIPHLLSPVVTELERVVPTLKWATREMERRYKVFAKHACRNLESYKQLARRRADLEPMPYIVVIIDELADLMMMAPDEIETQICRLAQMARATGIHLVLATQRPSVDVITGLIKANFPSRMAFAVTSQIDSRVILDTPGAEQLLGRGDMLYMAADAAKLVRVQGTWVTDGEVEHIVSFWRNAQPPETDKEKGSQGGKETGSAPPAGEAPNMSAGAPTPHSPALSPQPSALGPQPSDLSPQSSGLGEYLSADEQDELLPQAVALVKQHQRASASLLQRRLRIGYSKAAQLIDLLEQEGVVGPAEGGRSREVLREGNGDD